MAIWSPNGHKPGIGIFGDGCSEVGWGCQKRGQKTLVWGPQMSLSAFHCPR